ncbi:hypothetical protein ACR777_20100 [Sphingobacterium spiritivorum]|uniref:hypothetical protein n=1 Tax=Sphingobacterium spiritivorum TaxID=258 RepID=UPI003DA3E551
MAQLTLKGIVKEVSSVEEYGKESKKGRRQSFILFIPGFVDDFGEKRGSDEEWQIDIFNDNIEKYGLNTNTIDKKVEVDVYISGRSYEKKEGGKGYAVNVNLKSIKEFGKANKFGDDLPF